MMDTVWDVLSALLLLCGSILFFCAAAGLLRFPDLLSRMHADLEHGGDVGGRRYGQAGVLHHRVHDLADLPINRRQFALRAGQVSQPADHRREIEETLGR